MSQRDFIALAHQIVQRQRALSLLAMDIENDIADFWQQAGRIQPSHPAFADLCQAYKIIAAGSDTAGAGNGEETNQWE